MRLDLATDVETLYESAYRSELAQWESRTMDVEAFGAPKGPYDRAFVYDTLFFWIPATFLPFLALLLRFGNPADIGLFPVVGLIPGIILADTLSKSRRKAGKYGGVGPFGFWAYRKHLREYRGGKPERLDPWSSEGIAKAVAFARRHLMSEQSGVLERIAAARADTEAAIQKGDELLNLVAASGGDSILRSARADALRGMVARNRAILRDLDAQGEIAKESPRPILARLEALESEVKQRDMIAAVLSEEEKVRLREAEAEAIRESVAGLVRMVQRCEDSLSGIRTEVGLQEAAEQELRQTLEGTGFSS